MGDDGLVEMAAIAAREAVRPYQRLGPDSAQASLEWTEMQEVYQRQFRMMARAVLAVAFSTKTQEVANIRQLLKDSDMLRSAIGVLKDVEWAAGLPHKRCPQCSGDGEHQRDCELSRVLTAYKMHTAPQTDGPADMQNG